MSEGGRSGDRDARLARARACLDAFGADPARWPETDRPLFARYKDDYRFEAARREAAALDAALLLDGEGASDTLRARLLASAPPPRRGLFWSRVGSAGPFSLLAPAGALVSLAALGFVAGLATAGGAEATDGAAERAFAETFGDAAAIEESP